MNLWEKYKDTFKENSAETAFCIANRYFSYAEFTQYISGSQQLLHTHTGGKSGLPVGVICHDSIETFASIFAIWFSGCHVVPLHPLHPTAVNNEKIKQSFLELLFTSEVTPSVEELEAIKINTKEVKSQAPLTVSREANRAYILFTSGSTGKPKGVPINTDNLDAFVHGFLELYPDLTASDRFLQTYDLTSDAAFTGYLIPLLLGASVYTLPPAGFKYLSIVSILQQHAITWTQFTPSILNFLRPYFKSMRFDLLKHSHFGGEALPYELVSEWSKCIPHAEISNIYGPTETTITSTIHRTEINQLNQKVYNGIISIGKPLKEVKILILDENNDPVAEGAKGELCIGGAQVMENYLNSEESKSFFMYEKEGLLERYYRSGDLVFQDRERFLYFCGRKDDQLKISGYRVEPAEIEYAISQLTGGSQSRAFTFKNKSGTDSMVVFTAQCGIPPEKLKELLKNVLPSPLIPEKIISVSQFPINSAGKVDKPVLFEQYESQIYE